MLRECAKHGYFRGWECPQCGEHGKFMMDGDELEKVGRTLAGVLRHFPSLFGLEMDPQGWVNVESLVDAIRRKNPKMHWLREHHIHAIATTDPKGRYEIDEKEKKIRATYGHSLDLELDLPTSPIPDVLYYPTTDEEVELLLERGLRPQERTRIHLSGTQEQAVAAGKVSTEEPVVLKVNAKKAIKDGVIIQKAGKVLYVAKEIPKKYLSIVD